MQGDALAHDWLTQAEFANAVAYGQITPGPVTHTIALIGWGAAGPARARCWRRRSRSPRRSRS